MMNANMEKSIIIFRCKEGDRFKVPVALGLEIPAIRYKLKQDLKAGKKLMCYDMKLISAAVFQLIIKYLTDTCINKSSADYLANLPLLDLFNLIQAAHFLKIESLLNSTCQTLSTKLTKLTVASTLPDILNLFKIHHLDVDLYSERLLRNRPKEAFINDMSFLDMRFSPPLIEEIGHITTCTKRWQSSFCNCVKEIDMATNFGLWVKAIHKLDDLIKQDFRLASCLSGKITRAFVQILKEYKYNPDTKKDVQRPIISIISRARFDICNEVVENEVVPALVEIVSNGNIDVSHRAMLALMHLAYVSPNRYKVFVDKGALDAALTVFQKFGNAGPEHMNMSSLAMFLTAFCRGYSNSQPSNDVLTSENVKKVLRILEELLEDRAHCSGSTGLYVCYALSYLSYGMCVELKVDTFDNLLTLFTSETSLAGSALGVVGNIARWGHVGQIEFLTSDCGLWELLQDVLCFKYIKFQKEACQIISNIAAQHGTLIKELIAADTIDSLCYLLEYGVPDVKLEATWAIFNGICGFNKVGEVDQYPETVRNRFILRDKEVQKGDDYNPRKDTVQVLGASKITPVEAYCQLLMGARHEIEIPDGTVLENKIIRRQSDLQGDTTL